MPADQYTHGHHESVLRAHRWRTAENSSAYLLPSLRPGQSLLDVGCGPATITADLAERVAPGPVVAMDNAEQAVRTARETLDGRGMGQVTVETGDVYALAHADASFDVVHAHQVLQHLTDPVAALREMRRVVKPGGVVAARDSDYAAMTWYPHDPALTAWLDLYHAVARGNGAEPDAGRQLLAWARAAGYSDVVSTASVWCFATPDDRAWWGGLWADRVTSSAFAEQAQAGGLASTDDLERIAAAWRNWAASPDAWFAVLHGEILAHG